MPRICYDKLSDQCGLDNHSGINGAPRKYHRKSCKASATAAQIFRLKGKKKKKKIEKRELKMTLFCQFFVQNFKYLMEKMKYYGKGKYFMDKIKYYLCKQWLLDAFREVLKMLSVKHLKLSVK